MLRELRIANFAIIDEMALSFAPGMNVLTGETGAGKSVITRAITLLCGTRATADLIRSDAEEAEIEGLFDLDDSGRASLADSGLQAADELLIRRLISRSGKGRVSINGGLASAGLLAQLGERLMHVYGQHEHALLLRPDSHLAFIDEFGKLDELRARMAASYEAFREASGRLASLTAARDATRQRLELLRFQAAELRDTRPVRGEEEELQRERERQRHAEKLRQICEQSEEALYSGDQAIAAALARLAAQLQEAARIDAAFHASVDALRQSATQVEDVAVELRRAAARIEHDRERLEQIEERLALLARLKRKHECDADGLVDRLAETESELGRLESSGADVALARQEALTRAAQAWEVARTLSRARQAAAAQLQRRMAAELRALGMGGGVFRAEFTVAASDGPQPGSADLATAGLGPLGADVAEFYLSVNRGEVPKSLARVASGGELSRIMLALKALTAGAGEVATLIFDEVDAGIGSAVAQAVGRRLHALGRSRQVLCVTHLPQIAALADHHFAIEKRVSKGRTNASARILGAEERVQELARMLGDAETVESQRHARRLMEAAGKAARR